MKVMYVDENKKEIRRFSKIEDLPDTSTEQLDLTRLYFVLTDQLDFFINFTSVVNTKASDYECNNVFDGENQTLEVLIKDKHFNEIKLKINEVVAHLSHSFIHNAKENALATLQIDQTITYMTNVKSVKETKLVAISSCSTITELLEKLKCAHEDWPVY
jgi:hypothetical protein